MSTTGNFIKTKSDSLFENRFQALNYNYFLAFFFVFCLVLIALTFQHPIGDFGNYYYGSKFFRQGIDPLKFYQDIHFFNGKIKAYETGIFFENYTPVPPFSLIFYWPFTFFNLLTAKMIFNLFCLFIFCFSLQRFIKTSKTFNLSFYFLPFIFFQPLYSNFHHGQTYLLIAALLFEFYIAWQNDRKIVVGLIIALLFSLKVFPALIAIVFIFKKDWKTIGWIALFTVALQIIPYFVIGVEVMKYYYLDIFPRLAVNDITEPFSRLNQSVYTFLLNGFIYQPYLNPSPVLDSVIIAVIFLAIFSAFVFSVFIKIILKQSLLIAFFISLLALALLNKYSTVYGLIVFFPVIFLAKEIPAKKMALVCFLLFLACNIPVYKLDHLPLFFQYPRPWLLLAIFLVMTYEFKQLLNLRYFSISTAVFLFTSLIFYKYKTDNLPEFRPKVGVVYNFEVNATQIKLFTCVGNRDTTEAFNFASESIDSTTFKTLNPLNQKAVFINNKYLVQMSDENTGAGMYYLKFVEPHRVE